MKIIIKILIVVIISLAANIERGYSIAPFTTVEYINVIDNLKAIEMNEVWKDIPGYEGYYQVSRNGIVRSVDRVVKRNVQNMKLTGVLMTSSINNRGYYCVSLCKNSKYKHCIVHKLVAITFNENPENKKYLNHKDGNKLNNYYKNIEWCTIAENNQHAYDTGLKVGAALGKFGKDHQSSKPLYKIDKVTNEILESFDSVHDVYRKYGFAVTNIACACRGTTKTSCGFKWKYKNDMI